jgi:hypothetical protein
MRTFLILASLFILAGCANQPAADNSPTDLMPMVGQSVTLSGKFELTGKVAPYIYCNGQPVYLVPQSSFAWGTNYERMQGEVVSISGVLHFRHFENVPTATTDQIPLDYFYFDAETAKVNLK